ncbi:MAG: OB-fold domain-containing protein [Sphingobium sp.]
MFDKSKLLASMAPITAADRAFWEGTVAGELRVQVGPGGGMHFPQISVDPDTLSSDLDWRKVSGRGRIWSWIVMHQRYLPAYADAGPYLVAMIELDEGPMIISGLQGVLDTLACGAPVEVVFEPLNEERALPMFRLAQ